MIKLKRLLGVTVVCCSVFSGMAYADDASDPTIAIHDPLNGMFNGGKDCHYAVTYHQKGTSYYTGWDLSDYVLIFHGSFLSPDAEVTTNISCPFYETATIRVEAKGLHNPYVKTFVGNHYEINRSTDTVIVTPKYRGFDWPHSNTVKVTAYDGAQGRGTFIGDAKVRNPMLEQVGYRCVVNDKVGKELPYHECTVDPVKGTFSFMLVPPASVGSHIEIQAYLYGVAPTNENSVFGESPALPPVN